MTEKLTAPHWGRGEDEMSGKRDGDLAPPSFEEACAIVADLFEAIPEIWTTHYRGKNADGHYVDPWDESAVQWCAGGAVMGAMGDQSVFISPVFEQLSAFTPDGYLDAADANNRGGRLVAIKMLRMAAGQIKS